MIGTLLLWFTLSLGLQENTILFANGEHLEHAPIYAELEFHAENEYIDIYGIYKNEMMKKEHGIEFAPMQDYFTVGATISIGNFSLGVKHECEHPVGNADTPLWGWYGGYNKIEITFSSK